MKMWKKSLTSLVPFLRIHLLGGILSLSACTYHLGVGERTIPGGAKAVAIPVFRNKTMEPNIEMGFTNALIEEFKRSRVTDLTTKEEAEAIIEGEILEIRYVPGAKISAGDSSAPFLPQGTVLTTEYRINVIVEIRVVRKKDSAVLWSSRFTGERNYVAPQVTLAGVNSVNPLYNLSARRQNIDLMANDMMIEAHSRITESF